jgi:hypothetical protein
VIISGEFRILFSAQNGGIFQFYFDFISGKFFNNYKNKKTGEFAVFPHG